MSKRLPFVIAAILTTALIATGCGGDDDETTTPATTTTGATGGTGATGAAGSQSEFARQADEICKEGEKQDDATADEVFGDLPQGQEPSSAQLEEFVGQVGPSIQDQIDQISELTPPAGEEDLVEQFLDQANQDLDAIEEDPSLLAGDEDPFAETQQLAEQLGITECAN